MIDRDRVRMRHAVELDLFDELHPVSARLAHDAQDALVSGVPMPWMTRWPGRFPLFVDSASGARFRDVDGHEYVDFCMGDTGAMAGHGLDSVATALHEQARRGITTMMPTDDSLWVSRELTRRFGVAKWQYAMSATDANRFVLRLSRALTRRSKVAVMDWCYHGTVDETLVVRGPSGETLSRPGAIGPQVDPALTTRVAQFNDIDDLDRVLSHGDVAVLLMEPALTNIGIVLPSDGYLGEVRDLTRHHGVLLAIDETHTICAGPGGCTARWQLEPDIVVIGKPIGGGMPVAAYGLSDDVAAGVEDLVRGHDVDVSGIGGTLSGNALAMAALRATLSTTMRDEDFERMEPLAARWTDGVRSVYENARLPWHVQQLGCRAEYWFSPPPKNGAEAAAATDHELDAYFHLFCLNRGVLLTPFHNMALMSPSHTSEEVDRHTRVFADAVASLVSPA